MGQANAVLARYDGLLQGIINPEVLLSPLTTQEAVLSSKIEGTQATLDEVLEHEAGQKMSPEKTDDILEIVNYRVALQMVSAALSNRLLSLQLIREMHSLLMNGVRGEDKMPFRVNSPG
ncbi:MAG: probable filamentation induced by cAMP protein Fic [Leptospirillum rubarum]|nr:MAG: probable filamentation induced by cAMP protein Fic [Leptospirillum rubarum]